LTGAIQAWVDVGLPDEREVRKPAGARTKSRCWPTRAGGVDLWWQGARQTLERSRAWP
jgi:uncharacterized protein YaeQ